MGEKDKITKAYEKPTLQKENKMTFPLVILQAKSKTACKQCSSCHGCR